MPRPHQCSSLRHLAHVRRSKTSSALKSLTVLRKQLVQQRTGAADGGLRVIEPEFCTSTDTGRILGGSVSGPPTSAGIVSRADGIAAAEAALSGWEL
jgi:hypothetical protein